MALSWNLNGLRAHSEELRLIISRHKPFIVCLQETHLLPLHPLSLRGFNIYRFDQDDGLRAHGGSLRYSSATPCSRRNTTFEPTSKQCAYGYTYHPSLLRCVVYTFPLAKSCHKRNSKMFFSQLPAPFFIAGDLMPTIPSGVARGPAREVLSSKILLTSKT